MRFLIAALLLLLALPVRAEITLGLTAPAWAGFDEGVAAYDRGDYATALAAAQGGTTRDTAVKSRDAVAAKMSPEQIAEAQRVAREWMAAFEKRKKK